MNTFKVYAKLKIVIIKNKLKGKNMQKSYIRVVAKNVGTVERERERAAFYINAQEENKINKTRVGVNSTLSVVDKNQKESIML